MPQNHSQQSAQCEGVGRIDVFGPERPMASSSSTAVQRRRNSHSCIVQHFLGSNQRNADGNKANSLVPGSPPGPQATTKASMMAISTNKHEGGSTRVSDQCLNEHNRIQSSLHRASMAVDLCHSSQAGSDILETHFNIGQFQQHKSQLGKCLLKDLAYAAFPR